MARKLYYKTFLNVRYLNYKRFRSLNQSKAVLEYRIPVDRLILHCFWGRKIANKIKLQRFLFKIQSRDEMLQTHVK